MRAEVTLGMVLVVEGVEGANCRWGSINPEGEGCGVVEVVGFGGYGCDPIGLGMHWRPCAVAGYTKVEGAAHGSHRAHRQRGDWYCELVLHGALVILHALPQLLGLPRIHPHTHTPARTGHVGTQGEDRG